MESKIGKILSERTTKIVIMLVLVMLFLLPVFNIDTYDLEASTIHDVGLKIIKNIYYSGEDEDY